MGDSSHLFSNRASSRCVAMAERHRDLPATASWRCSEHPSRRKTTCARSCWPPSLSMAPQRPDGCREPPATGLPVRMGIHAGPVGFGPNVTAIGDTATADEVVAQASALWHHSPDNWKSDRMIGPGRSVRETCPPQAFNPMFQCGTLERAALYVSPKPESRLNAEQLLRRIGGFSSPPERSECGS